MNAGGANSQAQRWARVCGVLDQALGAAEAERPRILDESCAGDPYLRAEVESLLRAESVADAKLENRVLQWAEDLAGDEMPGVAADHVAGDLIGSWRLLEEIGRGGMGTVWRAERADGAFEQRAALKLIRRGLDSDAILGRFLAERRILARLQHPNIAHLVDGGMTEDGRPYFAMELADGEPVTHWCDAHRLPVRARIRLLLTVIDAVQYAHQQLVIHRDLKPSNILVTAAGEAKLLDFGIAKLLDAEAARAESATLTQLGLRMLTPEYAAPEQLRGEAATTATDVYALGVLLYELLVGERPTAARNQQAASADSSTRPLPRPSTRASEQAARDRASSRDRLRRMLRGDLDTIVLRALHEESERRYRTAEALGDDLRRYLDGRPVRARPDSAGYRLRKFVMRNRLAVAAAALIALSLTAGLVATAWQARRAELRAEEAKRQAQRAEEVKGFLVRIFEAGAPREWRGKEPTARELLDAGAKRVDEELAGNPALHAEMQAVIGELYLDQGRADQAEKLLRRSLEQRSELFGEDNEVYADSLHKWANLLYDKGNLKDAIDAQVRAVAILRRELGDHPRTARALIALSLSEFGRGNADIAIGLQRDALDMDRRTLGSRHASVVEDLRLLAGVLTERERYSEAEPLFEEAIATSRQLYGPHSVRYALALSDEAVLHHKRGETERASATYRETADIYRQAGDLVNLEDAINHYGLALCRLGRFEEAERNLREALDLAKQTSGASARTGIRSVSLGGCLAEAGRYEEADSLLRSGLGILDQSSDPAVSWIAFALRELAASLVQQERAAEARPLAERALKMFEGQLGPDGALSADTLRILSRARFMQGEREQGLMQAEVALQKLRRAQGADHPRTAAAALNVAEMKLRLGADREAETRLREIAPTFDRIGDRPGKVTVSLLRGAALSRLGSAEEAEKLLRDALADRRSIFGDGNPKVAEAEIHLGMALMDHGRATEGRRLLEHGLSILKSRKQNGRDIFRQATARLRKN